MKLRLYQIAPERDKDHLMFRDLQHILDFSGNRVPAEIYECVYCGDPDVRTVEDAFYVFNMEHPKRFRGRSMSVSDVVETFDQAGNSKFFFCDVIGFERIDFEK